MRRFFTWCLLAISMTYTAQSDSPPPAAKSIKVFSSNRHFYAFSSLKEKKTYVFSAMDKQKALWDIPGYHPVLFLSDDGQYLVVGYPGGNLLNETVKASDLFLCFFHSGQFVRGVHISDIFSDLNHIPQSTSGRAWGNYFGFDERNHFILLLFDGKRITFDANTGQLINR